MRKEANSWTMDLAPKEPLVGATCPTKLRIGPAMQRMSVSMHTRKSYHANSTMQARKKASKVVEEEEEPEEASVPEEPTFARRCVFIIRALNSAYKGAYLPSIEY